MEKNQSGTKLVINVYTKEKTAAGLVKINDELLRNNLANNDTLLFNYFNDKETAKTYFNKIASASASKPMLWQPLHGGWAVIKSY